MKTDSWTSDKVHAISRKLKSPSKSGNITNFYPH
jgi:hypothetical protein